MLAAIRRPLLLLGAVVALATAPASAEVSFRAAIVVEPSTGAVLYAKDPHAQLPTASMIKMLNALVVMDALQRGEVTWDTPVHISKEVERVEGSQVYLKESEVFTIRQLLTAMLVKSANDAAAALAEGTAGTIPAFVERMRAKARALGLRDTEVYTPNGLPTSDTHQPEDRSSPADLARMGAEVLKFPDLRVMVTTRLAPFREGEMELFNPDRLLGRYPFATGIKTGYHEGAGFCVTSSARRDGMELIAVVMGAPHRADRFDSAEALLEEAFAKYRLVVPVRAGELLAQKAPVAHGRADAVPVLAAADYRVVVRRDHPVEIARLVDLDRQSAPVAVGERVGRVVVKMGPKVVAEIPAVAAGEVAFSSPLAPLRASGWRSLMGRFLSLLPGF
jgi:D-alanyl-D-alanine carboxypeptidase (penicillin-binding protein 5/6)